MKKYHVLNVSIDTIGYDRVLDFISAVIKEDKKAQIATVNNEFIVEAQKNERFLNVLNSTSLNVADSTGVVWAVKKLYGHKLERIPGADLFEKICALSQKNTYRIFLFGGDSGVGEKAKSAIYKKYPGIHIVGYIDGVKVDANDSDLKIITKINQSRPDIIFVALGAPKQEIWIANNLKKLNARVFIGVGGTLDFVSGKRKRAPAFLRKIGLEWLFRLFVEPRRMGRIANATIVFPWLILTSPKKEPKP